MPQEGWAVPEAGPGGGASGADGPGSPDGTPAAAAGEAPAGVPAAPAAAPRADPVAWLIALASFGAYTTISVFRYLRLDPGSWDLGIFTEYVRQVAYGHAPVVAIRGAGFNLLGDHFQPIVALIAPFFRLFPTPVTLLVAQALLTAVSVVPVCRAARELLGTWQSRAIGGAYGFSWGLQQMVNFDFHEVAFAVPLLAFSLSALVRRRPRGAVLWALPLVFVKEDQGFTVAVIGLVMIAMAVTPPARARRSAVPEASAPAAPGNPPTAEAGPAAWGWAGALLIVWGLAWSVAAIGVIIPHFNPTHHYQYWSDGGVVGPGGHVTLPALLHQLAADGAAKLRTMGMILLPVAFIALGSPLALIALPSLLLRFVSTNSYFWGTGWHYNATVMPILFLAAIDAMARLRARAALRARRRRSRAAARNLRPGVLVPRYGGLVMLAIAVWLAFRFPLATLWNPQTYVMSPHVRAERAAMALVPGGASVEATLSMLAPLAVHDDTLWIGNGNPAPRYIVFDESNSGWSPPPGNPLAFVDGRHPGVSYRQVFLDSDVYVFQRAGRDTPTGG